MDTKIPMWGNDNAKELTKILDAIPRQPKPKRKQNNRQHKKTAKQIKKRKKS